MKTQELIDKFESEYRGDSDATLIVDVKDGKLILALEGIIQKTFPLPVDYTKWFSDTVWTSVLNKTYKN